MWRNSSKNFCRKLWSKFYCHSWKHSCQNFQWNCWRISSSNPRNYDILSNFRRIFKISFWKNLWIFLNNAYRKFLWNPQKNFWRNLWWIFEWILSRLSKKIIRVLKILLGEYPKFRWRNLLKTLWKNFISLEQSVPSHLI